MDLFPLPPDATYSYGDRFGTRPEDHHGTDIFAAEGTPVLSPVAGVAHAETDPKGGFVVYVQAAGRREDIYLAHLLDWADLDTADYTNVEPGDVIGHVGATGNAAGGPPHLHLQVKVDGVLVNPFPLLRGVDPHPAKPDRTFPYPRKPTSSSVPEKGRWTKPGGPSITPSSDARTVSIWTVALILGAIAVWKTFAGNNHA